MDARAIQKKRCSGGRTGQTPLQNLAEQTRQSPPNRWLEKQIALKEPHPRRNSILRLAKGRALTLTIGFALVDRSSLLPLLS